MAPHPHAGISVMTYMLPGSQEGFINRDSHGDFSLIEPGGVHITQAGSGIQHDEFPKKTGIETHGFQIWLNHADKDRLVPPQAMHATADEIPEVLTDQYKVRVIHGAYKGKAPAYKMVTAVTLFHVFLYPNQNILLDADEMAFVYVLNGSGETEGSIISPQHLVNYAANGTLVEIQANANGCEFMFGSGAPHKEPITYGGPFVMTTPEQMAETRRRFERGEMGALQPYAGT